MRAFASSCCVLALCVFAPLASSSSIDSAGPLSILFAKFQPPASGPNDAPRPNDACYTLPAPPVASNVSCSGISKTVLHVAGAVDTSVDMVSVELRHANASGPPNVHFTLAARAGRLDGRVTGLDQGAAYRLAVRTHRAGCAEDGANGTWSDLLSVSGACETLSEEAATASEAVPPVDVPEARVATRWLEVFRIAEANRSLPDFLDNHDSGDMGGDGTRPRTDDTDEPSPLVHHCRH